MSLQTTTHLNFADGQARPALEFYAAAFGADVVAITYAQMGAVQDPADADKVVWGEVRAPGGFHVMAYDVAAGQAYEPGTNPFFVSLRSPDAADVEAAWAALSADAREIRFPLGPAPWGAPLYGQLQDRFGVVWVLDVAVAYDG